MKKKMKILIVRSLYNKTNKILKTAVDALKKDNVLISIIEVPGAFEIPVIISRYINKFDGFIAIGSIIKGETPNFNFISQSITDGIMTLSILNKKPIGNAIITCLNDKQESKRSNKGREAAIAVIDVLKCQN